MYCQVRVEGLLDPTWHQQFADLHITPEEGGTTRLSGALPDQAALQGILLQIVRLGLALVTLETSEAPGADVPRQENAQSTRIEHHATAHEGDALSSDETR